MPRPPIRKRRRSFLLVEVLIAFALISLCLFPLLRPQRALVQQEQVQVEKMQLERLAERAFATLYEKLATHTLAPFDALKKGVNGTLETPFILYFPYKKEVLTTCHYKLTLQKSYSGDYKYLLLDAELSFETPGIKKDRPLPIYTYSFLVGQEKAS